MKRIGLSLTFVLLAILTYAQPKIQFDEMIYDFGTISEEGGRKTGRFVFTNTGDSVLVLKSVRPSCGCTAANYTRTEVTPGEQGFIDVTYDPRNRPGTISKVVRVTTNEPQFEDSKTAPYILSIKGNVAKRPPTEFEKTGYNLGEGMVRIKDNNKRFEIKNTEIHVDTFLIRNFWDKGVTVELIDMPPYIKRAEKSFNILQPGKDEYIVLEYDAAARNAFGKINDQISIKTSDSIEPVKTLFYNVTIKEDFSGISPKKMKNAPVIELSSSSLDFGQAKINITVTQEITITNKGKSSLIIRTIQPNTSNLTSNVATITIPKGKSETIIFTYKTNNRAGKQNGTIDIISNDPTQDVIVVPYTIETSK